MSNSLWEYCPIFPKNSCEKYIFFLWESCPGFCVNVSQNSAKLSASKLVNLCLINLSYWHQNLFKIPFWHIFRTLTATSDFKCIWYKITYGDGPVPHGKTTFAGTTSETLNCYFSRNRLDNFPRNELPRACSFVILRISEIFLRKILPKSIRSFLHKQQIPQISHTCLTNLKLIIGSGIATPK